MVINPLHDKQRTTDRRQVLFDIPVPVIMPLPGIVPAEKRVIHVITVIAFQLFPEVRCLPDLSGFTDTIQTHFLVEDMRCHGDDAEYPAAIIQPGMDQGNRPAVGMPDQNGPFYTQDIQHCRQ